MRKIGGLALFHMGIYCSSSMQMPMVHFILGHLIPRKISKCSLEGVMHVFDS